MAIDERPADSPVAGAPREHPAYSSTRYPEKLKTERKMTFGIGLFKGMAVTLKHLFMHNTVIQYPEVKQDLSPRTRGVIALKEENCTVCMLCARECPDWCIYIDSHKETLPPKRAGGRPRKRNVLDRFAIDYALCMYCGICVEVCPYDALFWSREFEYAEFDIRELTHEKERLSDWMASVLPPPSLEQGAELPGQAAAPIAAGGAGPGSAQRPAPPAAVTAAAERPEQAAKATAPAQASAPAPAAASPSQVQAGETAPGSAAAPTEEKVEGRTGEQPASAAGVGAGSGPSGPDAAVTPTESVDPAAAAQKDDAVTAEEGRAVATGAEPAGAAQGAGGGAEVPPPPAVKDQVSQADVAKYQEIPGPNVEVPHEEPHPRGLEQTENAEEVYAEVLQEQLDKGSSPQVAEARAKVARVKAERGIKRGPTPIYTPNLVPSAPTGGHEDPSVPSGAPSAAPIQPDPGPVAPNAGEAPGSEPAAGTAIDTAGEEAAPAEEASAGGGSTTGGGAAEARDGAGAAPAAGPGAATEGAAVPTTPTPVDAGGAEDPEAAYERVLAEERAKGSSDAVAMGRAKAARVRAQKAKGRSV
ncbi:MAG: NADH-quinone oxidoreductase subunit [Actinomycetota bacterium]|nr:NADH-quinone oxidoreductase subunit [Actinomycetota bacterium]